MRRSPLSLFAPALLGLLPMSASAYCPSPSTGPEIAAKLQAAEASYAELEVDAFVANLDEASIELGCLGETIHPKLSAWFHRLEGLRRFTHGDAGASAHALAAARRLEPTYRFPTTLLPEGHEVVVLYDDAAARSPTTTRIPPPRSVRFAFDGTPGRERPDTATVVQLLDLEGSVQDTLYLLPDDALPPYDVKPVARNNLLLAGAGATALAIGAYGLGAAAGANFRDPDSGADLQQLQSWKAQTWTFAVTSGVLGAGALGLFGASVAVGTR